jgi:hypothetical protein
MRINEIAVHQLTDGELGRRHGSVDAHHPMVSDKVPASLLSELLVTVHRARALNASASNRIEPDHHPDLPHPR